MSSDVEKETVSINFIERIINKQLEDKKRTIITRFPPEPNGFLHIGHAKSLILNFGLAEKYNGICNLRFDDTNPIKEDSKYIEAIKNDIKWLGFDWNENLFFASSYFEKMFELATILINKGFAYVDDQSASEIRQNRGTIKEPGINSKFRERSVKDNLELFTKMKNGDFIDGEKVLRAKIDMKSPNLNMRDPVMYRILKKPHPLTGDKWKIYPMYDWAHGLEDSIEGITHSICTLEFEDHRPLYNWFLDQFPELTHPQQIEFARLNLNFTVMSKRKLQQLVEEKIVSNWDDPRLPTLSGLKRRGYTPKSIRMVWEKIGIAKMDSTADYALLEFCLKEDLNETAQRRMAVLDPLKIIITNFDENREEWLDAENNPGNENQGSRKIPFSRELYIEQEDFMLDPPKKYFRLAPGKEIRLKHAYYITCTDYDIDENDKVTTVYCTYDPKTKGGWSDDGRKVRGTSHWVSATHGEKVEVNLYNSLFTAEFPGKRTGNFLDDLNPNSLETIQAIVEPSLIEIKKGDTFQFLRKGYYTVDSIDEKSKKPIFNRTVTLRDNFSKFLKK